MQMLPCPSLLSFPVLSSAWCSFFLVPVMEKLSVHHGGLKRAKAKKRPVKVVYISNPMRVKATASQFKDLVQELTGQYSDIADLSKFADPDHASEVAADQGFTSSTTDDYGLGTEELHRQQHQQQQRGGTRKVMGTPFDMPGEVFTPDVLEDLDLFMPASPFYKPSRSVDEIWEFDMA